MQPGKSSPADLGAIRHPVKHFLERAFQMASRSLMSGAKYFPR
jgi:hypothetical protein